MLDDVIAVRERRSRGSWSLKVDKIDAVAASGMVSSSVLAALIQMLFAKGALSLEEVQ